MKPLVTHSMIAAAAMAGLAGCTALDTLKVSRTVLVKVPQARIKTGIAKQDGWNFRHVLQAPQDENRRGQWYVAWNDDRPLRTSLLRPYWIMLARRTPEIADATKAALGDYPVLLEPNRTFTRIRTRRGEVATPAEMSAVESGQGNLLAIGGRPSPSWAHATVKQGDEAKVGKAYWKRLKMEGETAEVIDPLWYLRDDYSQLATAGDRVKAMNLPGRIRIGHLDNGLDERHTGAPRHLLPEERTTERTGSLANAVGRLEYEQYLTSGKVSAEKRFEDATRPPLPPGKIGSGHGLGTIGLLAGGHIRIRPEPGKMAGYDGDLGGAPEADIVPVRVAPWVASISTAELAYGIDYASRRRGCDVISMSHGGAPTQAWVDAVNAAYERGTAMFAAESDFFSLAFDPIPPHGVILPSSPVYPAAFRRVVGVTGVTADGRSYGRNTLGRLIRAPWKIGSWVFRGSYGADGTSTVLYRPNEDPDPSQVKRQGGLRPYPISAYAPNTPSLSLRKDGKRYHADGLSLDGGGTSAATPQVAAAAALWLQAHRGEFTEEEWKSGIKPEAVYFALLKSAERGPDGLPDRYLGAGQLKADRALDWSLAEIKRETKPDASAAPAESASSCDADPSGRHRASSPDPAPGSLYFSKVGNDYFDGARSFWSFLGLHTRREIHVYCRAGLDQKPLPAAHDRETALRRLYYNTSLLRSWHHGSIPVHSDTARSDNQVKVNVSLWNKATRNARAAMGR